MVRHCLSSDVVEFDAFGRPTLPGHGDEPLSVLVDGDGQPPADASAGIPRGRNGGGWCRRGRNPSSLDFPSRRTASRVSRAGRRRIARQPRRSRSIPDVAISWVAAELYRQIVRSC